MVRNDQEPKDALGARVGQVVNDEIVSSSGHGYGMSETGYTLTGSGMEWNGMWMWIPARIEAEAGSI